MYYSLPLSLAAIIGPSPSGVFGWDMVSDSY